MDMNLKKLKQRETKGHNVHGCMGDRRAYECGRKTSGRLDNEMKRTRS